MPSIDSSIQWFKDKQAAKISYSMVSRNGPSSYDCSSAVYYALIAGGFLPGGHRIGNTDSLFGDLERAGWSKVSTPQRGDIFIWGVRGASSGAAGHTGQFTSASDIIHCAYGYNGIHVDNHSWLRSINGNPTMTFYRYTGTSQPYEGDNDQNLDVGSTIRFDKTYRVNDVQLIGGIWQVRTDELCRAGFTWDDNGIPAEPLVEVDAEGYATPDQNLDPGALYRIPGKYTVLDLGQYEQYWMALIQWNGLKFWVDVETATEIRASEPGAPVPGQRPAPKPPVEPPKPKPPVEEPKPIEPKPEQPSEPKDPVEPPVVTQPEEPIKPNDPKEDDMAFTDEQQQQLKVATQRVLDSNEFTPVISDKVKTVAYFATDVTAIVSGLVFTVLAIFALMDAIIAITVNAAITTALLGLKQTFRLSAKKQ